MVANMKLNKDITDNKGNRKIIPGKIIGIIAVAIVLIAGISIYNTPLNVLSRQIDLGYKYLGEEQYEAAALAFEEAIEIDDKNIQAYAGAIEAYANMDDEAALQECYDEATAVIENAEEELLAQNMDYAAEIYMSVGRAYRMEPEQAVKVLEKGWEITEKEEIKEELAENYFVIAKEENKNGNYGDELDIYDKLLALIGEDEKVLKSLEECLTGYLNQLMKEEKYDEVDRLATKYEKIVSEIDFETLLAQIEELKNPSIEQSNNWVDDLYQKIITEDVDGVFAVMSEPDFIEKCEQYPHEFITWSTDYCLSTGDGKTIWVVKAEEGEFLSIAYYPEGSRYGVTEGAPAVGWGDYVFEFGHDGQKQWFIKTIGYYESDESAFEMPENEIWEVYHM